MPIDRKSYQAAWYQANKERIVAYQAAYRRLHPRMPKPKSHNHRMLVSGLSDEYAFSEDGTFVGSVEREDYLDSSDGFLAFLMETETE